MERRRVVVWASFTALLCGLVVFLVALKTRGSELAGVFGLSASIVAIVVALVGLAWQREGRLEHELDRLARLVEEQADLALAGILSDGGPADVEFSPVQGLTRRSDGGQEGGSVANIADYLHSLDRGRLVVLGDAGAGKSMLLLVFALQELQSRSTADRGKPMVPVRMRLASFDPFRDGRGADRLGDVGLVSRFEAWMAREVMRWGYSRKAATQLVAERRILPLLDGLDEMGEKDRAVAVLRVLNLRAGSRPFMLTCRPASFRRVSEEVRLSDTSAVELKPLSLPAVRDYLLGRLGVHATASRWGKALEALESAADDGVRWPDPFVDALRSPWRLYLCATVFKDDGDPYDELAALAPKEMTNRLLENLIPALTTQDARTRAIRWRPNEVTRWLGVMARSGEPLRFDPADISLPVVWPAAGKTLPRFLGALCQAVLGWGLGALAFCIQYPGVLDSRFPAGTASALVVALLTFVGATAVMNTGMPVMVSELSLHLWRTKRGRRLLLTSVLPWSLLGGGALAGVVVVFSPRAAPPVGIITFGLLFLLLSMGRRPSAVLRPSRLVRRSVGSDLAAALLCGVAFGSMASFSGVPAVPTGILGAVLLARPTWFRYLAAIVLARKENRLPWRPARLLDWAYDAGLVRLSGSGVEFRHPELRSWLMESDSTTRSPHARRRARGGFREEVVK